MLTCCAVLRIWDGLCGALGPLGFVWFRGFSGWDGLQLNNPYPNLGNAPSSLITLEEDLDNAVAQFRKHSIEESFHRDDLAGFSLHSSDPSHQVR